MLKMLFRFESARHHLFQNSFSYPTPRSTQPTDFNHGLTLPSFYFPASTCLLIVMYLHHPLLQSSLCLHLHILLSPPLFLIISFLSTVLFIKVTLYWSNSSITPSSTFTPWPLRYPKLLSHALNQAFQHWLWSSGRKCTCHAQAQVHSDHRLDPSLTHSFPYRR